MDGFQEIKQGFVDLTRDVHADLIENERQKLQRQLERNRAAANGLQNGNVVINP